MRPRLPDEAGAAAVAGAFGLPLAGQEPEPEPAQPTPAAAPAPPDPTLGEKLRHAAGQGPRYVARKGTKRVLRPVAERLDARLRDAVDKRLDASPRVVATQAAADLNARLAEATSRLHAVEASAASTAAPAPDVGALEVNQELFKAELAGFRHALDELGAAIAPATGIAGVPARFAELRTRLDVLDKRVRSLLADVPATVPAPPGAETVAESGKGAAAPSQPATFDYVGFETRFRGDPELVLHRSRERYFGLLADAAPVLDIGCGRGEVLEALAAEGVVGVGVDLDVGMVTEARARGVDAHHADALAYLRDAPEGEFGAVIALQVVEHLELDVLLELIELSWSRLRPGGVLVFETPNPASLIVLGNSYLLDPTHVRPLHPSLLSFLVERAGFADVGLELYEPATGYHLPMVDDDVPGAATINAAFTRLNDVLFGPQDYAIIARR